jgi:TonB family protein
MRHRTLSVTALVVLAVALLGPGCAEVGRAVGVGGAPWGPALAPSGRDDYPPVAKDLGLTGRVGLECSVDARGYAHDVVIMESGGLVLDDAARKVFAEGHFLIPPNWSATGGPAHRFPYGVIFQLRGKPDVAHFDDNRLTVVVTGGGGAG